MKKVFEASGLECEITVESYTVKVPPSQHPDFEGTHAGRGYNVEYSRVIGKIGTSQYFMQEKISTTNELETAVKDCENKLKKKALDISLEEKPKFTSKMHLLKDMGFKE